LKFHRRQRRAAPEGIARVRKSYPTLPMFIATIDGEPNKVGYILPDLGDAGGPAVWDLKRLQRGGNHS